MKKQFLLIAILPILILSCATPKPQFIYDESIPVDESSSLSLNNLGTITGYNGITVEWKPNTWKGTFVQIPAGDTLLEIDLKSGSLNGNVIYSGNVLFRYNFQPGRQYWFFGGQDRESSENGLRVYAWNIGETPGVISEKYFEAFVPFLNASGNSGADGGKTVLE
jgi:hypothetical protein